MQNDEVVKKLYQMAKDYPGWLFTGEQISLMCNVSINIISRVKAHPESPFFTNKCRPEKFADWALSHTTFQLTKGSNPEKKSSPVKKKKKSAKTNFPPISAM